MATLLDACNKLCLLADARDWVDRLTSEAIRIASLLDTPPQTKSEAQGIGAQGIALSKRMAARQTTAMQPVTDPDRIAACQLAERLLRLQLVGEGEKARRRFQEFVQEAILASKQPPCPAGKPLGPPAPGPDAPQAPGGSKTLYWIAGLAVVGVVGAGIALSRRRHAS